MAEISEELLTAEQKVERAKEYFNRGSRNYLVKDYPEAAEDFSRACELYAELHGDNADELGLPSLFYAKSLIALAQGGENKVLAIPEENENEGDDDDDEDEVGEEANEENGEVGVSKAVEGENGTASTSEEEVSNPQPGTSSGTTNGAAKTNGDGNGEAAEATEDEEDATNLQYAWEALELAVKIFERMGEPALSNLADAHFELGEISLENGHCADAIKDYEISCDIRLKLQEDNLRIIAETKYKIGLCHLLLSQFDESIAALKESTEYLDGEISAVKAKEQTEKSEALAKEIEETKQEILIKIIEVEEAKVQSVEDVKREIAKLMNPNPEPTSNGSGSSSSAGGSSSSAPAPVVEKPKATDISHLIKRKKPDAVADAPESASPAKKPNLSGTE